MRASAPDGAPNLYHHPVLDALCVFMRDGNMANTGEESAATDIRAAVTACCTVKMIALI